MFIIADVEKTKINFLTDEIYKVNEAKEVLKLAENFKTVSYPIFLK